MKTPIIGTIDTAIPISLTEGVRWPAIPSAEAITYLAIAQQIDDSQWWSPELLRRQQFEQLAEMLAFAEQTIPFHRHRLQAAGFRADRRFTEETWAAVPILTPDELRAAGEALDGRAVPPEHGRVIRETIAGSDGRPIEFATTMLARQMADAFALREAQWDGRPLEGKLAVIAPAAAMPQAGGEVDDWGPPFREIYFTGPRVFCAFDEPVADQAAWVVREQPELLCGPVAAIAALVEYFRKNNLTLPSLRHVRSSDAFASSATHQACREVWGTRLFDGYSNPLAGPLAYPCPDTDGHHVHAERVVVEVVDDRGQRCAAGKAGQVVVTPLHNLAMPLVRLAVGGRAVFESRCRCGRGLPVLAWARDGQTNSEDN